MTNQDHLGGCYETGDSNTIVQEVWGWLMVQYNIQSMIDIGCGYGHAAEYFQKFLIHCTGVEGYKPAIENKVCSCPVVEHDYTLGELDLANHTRWNLGWCAEVVEHIEEKYLPNLLHTFKACDHVCITHAVPGQDGYHHVNCQTSEYWVDRFTEAGFIYDAENTALLRKTDRWKAHWGRPTLMLFHNTK